MKGKSNKLFGLLMLICAGLLPAHETSQKERDAELKEATRDFFSVGLVSSTDSIKTSVNLEVGLTVYANKRFQLRSLTSISGAKIYDDEPDLYQLGLMEKITFGQVDSYDGGISSARYGFCFVNFGLLSFDRNRESKFLFSPPYYWEVGGGAGANIRMSQVVALLVEVGGGLHLVPEDTFVKKLQKAGFGRMSLGFRYFL